MEADIKEPGLKRQKSFRVSRVLVNGEKRCKHFVLWTNVHFLTTSQCKKRWKCNENFFPWYFYYEIKIRYYNDNIYCFMVYKLQLVIICIISLGKIKRNNFTIILIRCIVIDSATHRFKKVIGIVAQWKKTSYCFSKLIKILTIVMQFYFNYINILLYLSP